MGPTRSQRVTRTKRQKATCLDKPERVKGKKPITNYTEQLPRSYGQHEPLGISEAPDEVEDEIMGNSRYIELPDGRIRFHNVGPMPAVSGNLPVAATRENLKDKACRGYKAVPVKRPIASGPIVNKFVDGEAWAKRMNEAFEKVSDMIIKAPFICLVFGTIGAGKTSTLLSLLNQVTVPGGFKKIVIGSKSLGCDTMINTWMRSKNPDVKVEFYTKITCDLLRKQANAVEKYYKPYFNLAERGRIKKEAHIGDGKHYADMIREPDSIVHPFTDDQGLHHHRTPLIPDFRQHRPEESPWMKAARATSVFGGNLLKTPQVPDFSVDGDYIKAPNLSIQEHIFNAVSRKAFYSDAAGQLAANRALKEDKGHYEKNAEPEPVLYVFEDAAYSYDVHRDAELMRLMSMIRHIHGSAFILSQKHKTCPLFIRTIQTDAIIFGTKNESELQSMEDEYSAVVTDFRGKLFAATEPIPGGPDRGFLFVKMREREGVYRGFEAKIEPVEEDCAET